MILFKKFTVFLILVCTLVLGYNASSQDNETLEHAVSIPTAGNSWVINDVAQTSKLISSKGIQNWSDPNQIIHTFFYVEKPGTISVGINSKVRSGTSVIRVTFGDNSKKIILSNTESKIKHVGDFHVDKPGYQFIELQGLQKEDATFAEVNEILLDIEDPDNSIKYIKDDIYFGRRGPSTHLIYNIPDEVGEVEWFYNEIEISEGQDVIGSYFMANGFGEGYFGIQVNSPTERRILFSIWSPYKTDDPSKIPEEYRITLLKKGNQVISGKFGNEGSGGQSYKKYYWKTNTRYRFLVRVKPTGDNSTDYTAYFFDPGVGDWNLIASFRRPKTNTYLKRSYSFLENFIPNTGVISRKGGFYNQWVCNSSGEWYEITEAKFSADQTAKKGARLDYSGGVENRGFYLKNCGFTDDHLAIGTALIREKLSQPPEIDFELLE